MDSILIGGVLASDRIKALSLESLGNRRLVPESDLPDDSNDIAFLSGRVNALAGPGVAVQSERSIDCCRDADRFNL